MHLTHVGTFAGVAPTYRQVTLEGFFLDQVVDGIVVEHNSTTTWPDVIRQIGAPAFQAWPARAPRLLTQDAPAQPRDAATRAANKAVVARLLQALSQGDADGTAHYSGIAALREEFAAIRTAFPDLESTLVLQAAEGDLVGTRATLRGTQQGALFGFAPTGKAIAWDFYSFDVESPRPTRRHPLMMAMNHDRALQWDMRDGAAAGRAKLTINLPADRVLADSDLIDQVIGLIFDHLAQGAVELRVHGTSAHPSCAGHPLSGHKCMVA